MPRAGGELGPRSLEDEDLVGADVEKPVADREARLAAKLGIEEDVVPGRAPGIVEEAVRRRQAADASEPIRRDGGNAGDEHVLGGLLVNQGTVYRALGAELRRIRQCVLEKWGHRRLLRGCPLP